MFFAISALQSSVTLLMVFDDNQITRRLMSRSVLEKAIRAFIASPLSTQISHL